MSLKLLRRVAGKAHAQAVSAPLLLATVTSINAKSTTPVPLYTVPASTDVVVIGVTLRCTAADSITDPATAGVGVAGGESDVFEPQKLYGLTAASKSFQFVAEGVGVTLQSGNVLKLGIDVAATGTSQTLEADVIGYEA